MREGNDLTVVAMSYMTIEALHAVDFLATKDIHCDLIDLRTVRPIDWDLIHQSVKKTGRILVLDTGFATGSVAGEIVARVAMSSWDALRAAPRRLAMPDYPESTSPALTENYHVRAEHIAATAGEILGRRLDASVLATERSKKHPHDVPGDWFSGPF
jgi:pyruvate dehydrogenase E1 component beta subunit